MARHLRIWLAQLRYSFVREMMFKANFLLWIGVDLAWFGLQITFIQVLFLRVDSIAGWTRWEMILLLATANLIQQIFQAFLMTNCMRLPELIRTGHLDFYLAQPASPQFLVSTRFFDPGAIVSGMIAISLVGWSVLELSVAPTPWRIAGYLTLVLCGVWVHYSIMLALMTFSFWMTRAQGVGVAYFNLMQLARLPREIFSGAFKLVFTWVLPLLLIANVPARTLAGSATWSDIAALLAATAFIVAAASAFFASGLRHYGSASS
jgi:ABC-2 type transport system permease protein